MKNKFVRYFLGALNVIVVGMVLISAVPAIYQAVRHDLTLTGDGITSSPLGVDTTEIATQYDLSVNGRGFSEITPTQVASDQNDYSPTQWDDADVVRLSGDASGRAITSLAAPATSLSPHEKILMNVGSNTLFFIIGSTDGTAANRLVGYPGVYKLYPGAQTRIIYDQTDSKWRFTSAETEADIAGVYYDVSPGSQTAGDHETFNWNLTGTTTMAVMAPSTTGPACFGMSTQSSATNFGAFYFPKTVLTYGYYGGAFLWTEAYLSMGNLSDGTQTYTIEVQLSRTPASNNLEDNNIIGLRYSHGINGGEWELFTQDNAGTESTTDTNVAFAADTPTTIRIEANESRSWAVCYINGAYAGKITANMPDAGIMGAKVTIQKSVGTTARVLKLHRFRAGAVYM